MRSDPQNLQADITRRWPGAGYAGFGEGDLRRAYVELAEVYDFVAAHSQIDCGAGVRAA